MASALVYAQTCSSRGLSDCNPTVKFILMFDTLFDIFNSRSPVGRGWKAPLSAKNFAETEAFLRKAEDFLMAITDANGKKIVAGYRKRGFWDLSSISPVFLVLPKSFSSMMILIIS